MPTIVIVILVVIAFVALASLMEWKSDRDRKRYECYIRMNFKGFANSSGCVGDGMPQCKSCYYYKLRHKKG